MTTVQEELEQSTEDITNAIEESSQRKSNLNDVCLRNSSNLQKDFSTNKLSNNAKERHGYEKETNNIQALKDGSNIQNESHSVTKVSSNGVNPLTISSTAAGHSLTSLTAPTISSVQSSTILRHNPSSSSPTVQVLSTTQVVSGTTVAHESGQVCLLYIHAH